MPYPSLLPVKRPSSSIRAVAVFPLAILCAVVVTNSATAQTYTLTINTLGSGTVSASPSGPYAAGTLVTLTASPAAGWSFSSWSGNLIGYTNPGTLLMNDNYTVTATFDQNGYQAPRWTGQNRPFVDGQNRPFADR
jgi:hypothetical protein